MSEKTCPHCGGVLTKVRSLPDHRRFFGVIRAAYEHWPEAHKFPPDNAEHLRAWLLCRSGYRNSVVIPVEGSDPAVGRLVVLAAESAIKAAGAYAFVRPHASGLAVFRPRSLAWDTLSQKEFGPIRQAIEDVITAETGLDCEQLLREKAA
jgi:hypothetical protein